MAAGSILIDLLMKTGSFEADTKRAEKRLAELKKEAQAMGVAVGAAFAAVGAASVAMVKSAIDAADEMGKMAQKAGVTVEEFSALAYAADLAGVSQDQLGSAMVKLSKNMSDAAEGTGEAVKGFDALGISVTNADGSLKSSDQILAEVADRFARMPDGIDKTTAAVNIFGRAGADLIPLLNGGSAGLAEMRDEAAQLGVILSTEASKAAEEFNDNLSRMGAAVTGVANKAAGELLPTLNEVSSMLVEVAKDETAVSVATDLVKTAVGGLITVFQTAAVVGSDVGFVFKGIGREIGALMAQADALGVSFVDMMAGPAAMAAKIAAATVKGEGAWSQFRAISDAVKADGERARAELDKFQARVMAIGQPGAVTPMTTDDLRRSEAAGRGAGARPSSRIPPVGRQGRGPGEDRRQAAFNGLTYDEQLTQSVGRLFESSDLIRAKVFADTLKRLDDLYFSGAINADLYDSALKKLTGTTEAIGKEAEQKVAEPIRILNEQMDTSIVLADDMAGAITGAMGDLISGGRDASQVFENLLRTLADMVIQIAVLEPMARELRAAFGGSTPPPANPFASGGGGGGFSWGSIIQSIGSFFGGTFADGGIPPVGKVSLVGERGPELFVPRTAGAIVPNHMLGGGAGGSPTIINQTQGRVDRVVQQEISPGQVAYILQQAEDRFVAGMHDPNSRYSRSMGRNYQAPRKR